MFSWIDITRRPLFPQPVNRKLDRAGAEDAIEADLRVPATAVTPLPAGVPPSRAVLTAVILEEVERLHWRLWNGKAKDAQISIDRIRAVMHPFQGEQGERKSIAPSRKLWAACTLWMTISLARATGWSTMPSAIAPG